MQAPQPGAAFFVIFGALIRTCRYMQVGGRVDYRQKINDVNFVLSGTDASARDYEAVPAVKDVVITADTHVNGECCTTYSAMLMAFDQLYCMQSGLALFGSVPCKRRQQHATPKQHVCNMHKVLCRD